MKKFNYLRFIYIAFYCLSSLFLFSSCIRDDDPIDCDVNDCNANDINLLFRYTYNTKESDAFGYEAGVVRVWVFDSDSVFVAEYTDAGEHVVSGFTMRIPSLPLGDYTFVAWAKAMDMDDEYANYKHTEMTRGVSTLTDLTARLQRGESNCCETRLNGTLSGTVSAHVNQGSQTVEMDMVKCTNIMRIILMPYRPGQQLDVDDYEFSIAGKSAWLNYDASLYREDPVIYMPYYRENLRGEQTRSLGLGASEVIDNAAVAEINMSRLFLDIAPRFVIKNKVTGDVLMNINLTWFLSLQAIGERKEGWSDQEYLDRQDNYSITFFVDGDTLMKSHIVVNGWVISLEDSMLS